MRTVRRTEMTKLIVAFRDRFSRNSRIRFHENPVGAELFNADNQTDRNDKANSRFSQFCEKRLKIVYV